MYMLAVNHLANLEFIALVDVISSSIIICVYVIPNNQIIFSGFYFIVSCWYHITSDGSTKYQQYLP